MAKLAIVCELGLTLGVAMRGVRVVARRVSEGKRAQGGRRSACPYTSH